MTKEEAFYIFGVEYLDEVENSFDDLFFDIKNFFVSKVPFTKLFIAKLNKLKRVFEAKEVLFPQLEKESIELSNKLEPTGKSNRIDEVYSLFGRNEMTIKLWVFRSTTFEECEFYTNQLIDNYQQNASYWKKGVTALEGAKTVKMSVEPDVMKVFEEIKRINSLGLTTFEEINQLENDNLLKQEAIRLSLWSKFEENV